MTMATQSQSEDYQTLQLALQDSLGVVVGEEGRDLIEGKLQALMMRERLSKLTELATALRKESPSSIRSDVLEAITTHNTQWFGYPEINRLLGDYILPSLLEQQKTEARIWLVGCGQGQSAYSLAMVIDEYKQLLGSEIAIEIVATDSSAEVIANARAGIYEATDVNGITSTWQQKYMEEVDGGWKVSDNIQHMLQFKTIDLLNDVADLGHFDVIISPDVLMYFASSLKSTLLDDYATLLDPSGILVLNNNEPVLPYCDRFELVEHEAGQFYRQTG